MKRGPYNMALWRILPFLALLFYFSFKIYFFIGKNNNTQQSQHQQPIKISIELVHHYGREKSNMVDHQHQQQQHHIGIINPEDGTTTSREKKSVPKMVQLDECSKAKQRKTFVSEMRPGWCPEMIYWN